MNVLLQKLQAVRARKRARERRHRLDTGKLTKREAQQKLGVAWAGDDFCALLSKLLRARGASLHISSRGRRGRVWAKVDGQEHDLITCSDQARTATSLFQASDIGRRIADVIALEGVVVGVRWESDRLYFWVTHPDAAMDMSWTIIGVLHGHQAEYPLEDA